MPQLYLILAVSSLILGNLKDLFSSITVSDQTKKLIRWGLIGVVLYSIWKIIQHNVNKTNALGDKNGTLAIQLHEAIYSQAFSLNIWGFGSYHIGNGDEAEILRISENISDYSQVSKFYKDLYAVDLYEDVSKVLNAQELEEFSKNIGKTSETTIDKSTGVAVINSPKPPAVGSAVYCGTASKVNIRSASDSSKVLYQVDKNTTYYTVFGKGTGYVGDFVKERKITISGKVYTAWEVDIPYEKQVGLVNLNYGLNGLIVKDFAYIKA